MTDAASVSLDSALPGAASPPEAAAHTPAARSATFRAWRSAVGWSLVVSTFTCIVLLLEVLARGGASKGLAMQSPAFGAVLLFGLPHYAFAVGFTLSSKRFHLNAQRMWFFGLFALGIMAAEGFRRLGGSANPVLQLAYGLLFTMHALRDESLFYSARGDCPAGAPALQARTMRILRWMCFLSLLVWSTPGFLAFMSMRAPEAMQRPLVAWFYPPGWPPVLIFALYYSVGIAFNAIAARHLARIYPGGWRAIRRDHAPLLLVLAGNMFLILLLPLIPISLLFFVLVHFVAWYRFAQRQQATTLDPGRSWFRQLKTARPAFRGVYLGGAAVVLLLLFVARYQYPESEVLRVMLSNRTFDYLTIIHVISSWTPR